MTDLIQALWAIPNITISSTRTPFIVTAFLVGLATYFIVFNLDSLASLGWKRYSGFRQTRIEQMSAKMTTTKQMTAKDDDTRVVINRGMTTEQTTAEKNDKWKERGHRYNRFEPDRGNSKPSEWYILLYFLLHPFKRSPKFEDEDEDEEEENVEGYSVSIPRRQRSSTGTAETSRVQAWKAWLRGPFKKPEAAAGEAAEAETAETSRIQIWKGWSRILFNTSEKNNEDAAEVEIGETTTGHSLQGWLRTLFKTFQKSSREETAEEETTEISPGKTLKERLLNILLRSGNNSEKNGPSKV